MGVLGWRCWDEEHQNVRFRDAGTLGCWGTKEIELQDMKHQDGSAAGMWEHGDGGSPD